MKVKKVTVSLQPEVYTELLSRQAKAIVAENRVVTFSETVNTFLHDALWPQWRQE